jgi:hypothetical protein
MAKKDNKTPKQAGDVQTNSFFKGLNKDADPLFVQEGMWTHARNASNNTAKGNLGGLSNEESNTLCSRVGTTMLTPGPVYIIGAIHLFSDKWIIFSVGYDGLDEKPLNSEIGLFESDVCNYRPIVQDACLNFNNLSLITGASKLIDDCSWQVYWADGLNPDRYLNVGDPQTWPSSAYNWLGGGPSSSSVNYYSNGINTTFLWPGVAWVQIPDPTSNDPACNILVDDHFLDCDKIRLATLVKTPCLDITASDQPGVIENGSYAIVAAYTINRQRVTNYFSPTYIQPIYNVPNERGSLEITVDADSENFDEFELVLIRFINQNQSAKQIGYYSTRINTIILDQVSEQNPTVPISDLVLQNPVNEKSEQMVEVNNYLLRVGPTSKFDFNYQPLANLIQAEWVSIEYPEKYYVDGGKNTSYLRDEVYAFFIRWVYDTGDKSASYNIPGRPPAFYGSLGLLDTDPYSDNAIAINTLPGDNMLFESINTATVTSTALEALPDGGEIIARGTMGYWQSTEIYPDNQPEVWNSSAYCWTQSTDDNYDLCGKPIRHHKFPDNGLAPQTYHFTKKADGKYYIRLMGVQFRNIVFPKDNDGNDIPGIVGYEILRSSRHGSKSILAKGMINNFRDYNIRGSASDSGLVGLYANHPFNTIIPQENNKLLSFLPNYLYNDPFITIRKQNGLIEKQNIPRDIISFHSPDTSFIGPYLSTTEVKIYGSLQGQATQRFIEPSKHPKFKLISNRVILVALVNGIADALLNGLGDVKIDYPAGAHTRPVFPLLVNGSTIPPAGVLLSPVPATGGDFDAESTLNANITSNLFNVALNTYLNAGLTSVLDMFTGGAGLSTIFNQALYGTPLIPGSGMNNTGTWTLPTYQKTYSGYQLLGPAINTALSVAGGVTQLTYFFLQGANTAVDVIYAIIRKRQYALELIGHGEYSTFVPAQKNYDRRFIMDDGLYVKDQIQSVPEYVNSSGGLTTYNINNLKRPSLVVLRTTRGNGQTDGPHYLLTGSTPTSDSIDQSLMTLGQATAVFNPLGSDDDTGFVGWKDTTKGNNFINNIASHYVGIKYRIRNQYGQLQGIQQIIATPCEQKLDFNSTVGPNSISSTDFGNVCGVANFTQNKTFTPAFFGGDTYINRFTEKNIMPFFYNWLYDVPDNIEFNYFLNQMIPEPKFQVNSQPWDISDFNLTNLVNTITTSTPDYGEGLFPTNYYDLDNKNFIPALNLTPNYPGNFGVKNSYFYIASCGIRDFFVESDVLVDFRDKGAFDWQQFYSKYSFTDLDFLFDANPEVLAKGNYYGYDYSLSAARFLFSQYFSAGYLQARDYDPQTAELCYVSYPNRILYSLQQNEQTANDAWLTYLPLNKVDFKSQINSARNFAKTGIFITFKNDSPIIYQGVDTLQLDDSGTKVTVGDAGLFTQAPQNLVVAEKPYEYGSSQNKYGVISTPAGLYYISQNQGKILSYDGGLKEISQEGMKWWFTEFLPFKLLEAFPDYPHTDNPVAGIACSASYDNNNGILFFSKKDYRLKEQFKGITTYDSDRNVFYVDKGTGRPLKVKLGDPRYFEDASWTVSYDPKSQFWISFHDWHPAFYIPNRNVFHTVKGNGIWKHEANCNDYCNFYGVQYPFEIEFPVVNIQNVSTVKSIEYYLECYRRERDLCVDMFHVLDYNFDQAVVFNSEQTSGYLNLNIYPKNDLPLALSFPKLSPTLNGYDILYSKEENKYRLNQFWDVTRDRGEFPIGSPYPPNDGPYLPSPDSTVLLGNYEERNIWVTEPNGYIKALNLANIDYQKPQLQRKKFRHYINYIKLSKANSRDTNMIIKVVNTKTQSSPR